jgi:hypothetical protein
METNLTFGSPGRKSQRAPRNTSAARAVRVLGFCGLLSAVLSAAAGFFEVPLLLGVAGATMVVGNVYAIVGGRRARRGER